MSSPDSPPRSSRSGIALLLIGVAALSLAAWIWATGGFRLAAAGFTVSARASWPPALIGLGAVAGLAIWRRSLAHDEAAALGAALARWEPVLALALALAILSVGVARGSTVAGGADSSGYLSQATLWRQGRLVVDEPSIRWSGVGSAWLYSPLGFRPGLTPFTLVPSYPPGLPLQLALASLLGARAIALVVPCLGAAAVWLAFALGRSAGGAGAGIASATLLATSPVFVYQLVQPMSDVPVTAWWLAAIAGLVLGGRRGPMLGGIASGIAILTRPNLVSMLLVVVPLTWWTREREHGDDRGGARRLASFAAGLAPFVVLLAWFNATLYGAPWASGYGDAGALFSVSHVPTNIWRYGTWLVDTHPALLILVAVGGATALRRARAMRSLVAPAAISMAVVVSASYLAYSPFESWTYLRFFLPAIAALAVLAAVGCALALQGAPAWLRLAACTIGLVLVAGLGIGVAREQGAFAFAAREQRYRLVAEWVRDHTSPDAVVICAQHSGSIHHTADRTILRWDLIDPGSTTCLVDCGEPVPVVRSTVPRDPDLRGDPIPRMTRPHQAGVAGFHQRQKVIVLDADEEPAFRARVAGIEPDLGLDWPPRAATPPPSARVYFVDDNDDFKRGRAVTTQWLALPR